MRMTESKPGREKVTGKVNCPYEVGTDNESVSMVSIHRRLTL